jgi:hypothetical protein
MSQGLTWSLDVAVVNGPHFSEAQALTFDAYDKIDVVVPAATNATTAGTATVEVQPGGAGQVQYLLLMSSMYDDKAKLTFKVDGGSAITLDAPLMLGSAGVVALLGPTQKQFAFSNLISPAAPVTVSILVGRKATV